MAAVAEERQHGDGGSGDDDDDENKVTAAEVAALGQLGGSRGGSVAAAAVLVRRQWQRGLDCLPHDCTPLLMQAGDDAAGVVVGCLDMYRTKVLMYHTIVLMACLTKVRR